MTPDEEHWAEARRLHFLKGNRVLAYIDERIGYLGVVRDQAGVERCTQVRTRVEQLLAVKVGLTN